MDLRAGHSLRGWHALGSPFHVTKSFRKATPRGWREFPGNLLDWRNSRGWGRQRCAAGTSGDVRAPGACSRGASHVPIPVPTLVSAGGWNLSVRGCGTRDRCQTEGFPALPGHRLAGPPVCSVLQRAVLDPKCHSGAALGLRLALPVLTVALGTATLS